MAVQHKTNSEKLPSGVYQIRCKITQKIYVGSAVNLSQRWGKHKMTLRRGTHRNSHLQKAWDKYGESAFEFEVLEYATRSELLLVEQKWIDKTRCTERKVGFNLYPIAGSPGDTFAQVWEGFIDPDGNEVTITNLFDFCRLNGLDFPSMHRLAKGQSKLKSYKGWTHKNSIRKREFIKTYDGFINPEGRPVGPIVNLAAFCREHGLDNTHMVAVAKGRLNNHRGWTHQNCKPKLEPKKYSGFVSPGGKRVVITNLSAFCRKFGLDAVHMHEVKSGKRKSHKGWTWRDHENKSSK
ncbi:MAG: GIY-YIG nuclease family protein [Acidobacteria bacterium]|nr:GIY-YIG nuclease family protein [Acidobacteriota bacterium]